MTGLVSQLSVAVAWPRSAGSSEASHSIVRLGAQESTGAIVSSTTMVCVQSVKLPQSSVTRYTRVTVPGQRPTNPPALINSKVSDESQLSLADPPAARKADKLA